MNKERKENGIVLQCAHLVGPTLISSIIASVWLAHGPLYCNRPSAVFRVPLQLNNEHIQMVSSYYKIFGLIGRKTFF